MAQYRFSAEPVSFGKGQSAVAKAAYNARTSLVNERDRRMTHDYSRGSEVAFSGIFAPKDAPEWVQDRGELWNRAEAAERQANGQPARNLILNLPHELTDQQREWLVKDYVRETFVRAGMVADVNIHRPDPDGDERNHHAHIMLTMREIGPEGFATTKNREWNSREALAEWKDKFAELGARALERQGFVTEAQRFRHGHEKLEQQRAAALERDDVEFADACDREPTQHRGPTATAMEREGKASRIGDVNRAIEASNDNRAELRQEHARVSAEIIDLADERTLRRDAQVIAPDPYERDDAAEIIAWDEALSDAAIFRETIKPQFMEPKSESTAKVEPRPDRELSATAGEIRLAYQLSDSGAGFAAALDARGLHLAIVTPDEAAQSQRIADFAKELGNHAPRYRAGELVAVNGFGSVYGFNQVTTGDTRAEIAAYLAPIDRAELHSVAETRDQARAESLAAFTADKQAERPLTDAETRVSDALHTRADGELLTGGAIVDPATFVTNMQGAGLYLARATAADIAALATEHQTSFAEAGQDAANPFDRQAHERATVPGWLSSALDVGELVAVDSFGGVHRFNPTAFNTDQIAELWTNGAQDYAGPIGDIASVRGGPITERAEAEATWREAREEIAAERFEAATDDAGDGRENAPAADAGDVADAAGRAISGAAKGAAFIFDKLAKPAAFIAETIASMFDGGDAPPEPKGKVARYIAQRKALAAMEGIYDSIEQGEPIKTSDVRSLSRSQLDSLRNGGPEALGDMLHEVERDRERGRAWER